VYLFITKILLAILSALFPTDRRFFISKPGKGVYLYRFHLWRSHHGDRYLHCIARDDDDPDPHDHPWDFTTTVLAAGYLDQQWDFDEKLGGRWFLLYQNVRRWTTVKRRASHIHRVILRKDSKGRPIPAWTYVKTGPYGQHRDWNFVTQNRKVPWREYLGVPEEGDR
jgi:hypothetical protein